MCMLLTSVRSLLVDLLVHVDLLFAQLCMVVHSLCFCRQDGKSEELSHSPPTPKKEECSAGQTSMSTWLRSCSSSPSAANRRTFAEAERREAFRGSRGLALLFQQQRDM